MLVEFEKWLRKRVDILFDFLKDFICDEWKKRLRSSRAKAIVKLPPCHRSRAPSEVPLDSNSSLDPKPCVQLYPLAVNAGLLTKAQREGNSFSELGQTQTHFQRKAMDKVVE